MNKEDIMGWLHERLKSLAAMTEEELETEYMSGVVDSMRELLDVMNAASRVDISNRTLH